MVDREHTDEDDPFDDDRWNEPVADDTDLWEDTPPIPDPSEVGQGDEPAWPDPTPEREAVGHQAHRSPPPRIRKRRIVCGVVFLILGLVGVLADGFGIDLEIAATIASLVGALILLTGLIASERRRRQILQLS